MTKSKRSTASDTATAKTSRWLRLGGHREEIDQLFDLYWGGKERRITRLTLKIISVNLVVLVMLVMGMIYFSQYQQKMIETKLEIFQTEAYLLTVTLSEIIKSDDQNEIRSKDVRAFIGGVDNAMGKEILLFDHDLDFVLNSREIAEDESRIAQILKLEKENQRRFQSVEMLRAVGRFLLFFMRSTSALPQFSGLASENAADYIDVMQAHLEKSLSISAWQDHSGGIVLTAAMPIFKDSELKGIALYATSGEEMQRAMGDMWFDIFKVFLFALFACIFISIYLSGVIARPLKNLAGAAERVRKGKQKYTEIPDMSERNDEIGDLSVVLREMMQALWERMDAIESFAADVSHEIKNPLTSLKSAVETLSIVKKAEDRDKLLAIIRHDIERLDRLITDISSASRLDAELSREGFSVIDVKKLVRGLLDVYKNPLEREQGEKNQALVDRAIKDGVIIEIKLPQDDCHVLGSEGRLIQVFQNIIANALSFSPLKSKIIITVSKKANTINIAVEDGGPGIPEKNLESVFDRFYSERPDHEDYGRHSGLGLSICKQIIQAHNGVIYAENAKDRAGKVKGARFVVILSALS